MANEKRARCTDQILSANAHLTGASDRWGDPERGELHIQGRSGDTVHFTGNLDGSAQAVAIARGMEGVVIGNPEGAITKDTTHGLPNPKAAELARNAVAGFNRCMK